MCVCVNIERAPIEEVEDCRRRRLFLCRHNLNTTTITDTC